MDQALQSRSWGGASSAMTMLSNPFEYLLPVPPDAFIGRWPLVDVIARDLTRTHGGSHACIGGRRFGKSSLLLALHYRLRNLEEADAIRVVPIFIDLKAYHFASEGEFFGALLHELRNRIDI